MTTAPAGTVFIDREATAMDCIARLKADLIGWRTVVNDCVGLPDGSASAPFGTIDIFYRDGSHERIPVLFSRIADGHTLLVLAREPTPRTGLRADFFEMALNEADEYAGDVVPYEDDDGEAFTWSLLPVL